MAPFLISSFFFIPVYHFFTFVFLLFPLSLLFLSFHLHFSERRKPVCPLPVKSLYSFRKRLWRLLLINQQREREVWGCSGGEVVRDSTFQISSINHKLESNVTNILQLEETRWSWGPFISLTPHDHRFIRAEEGEEEGRS